MPHAPQPPPSLPAGRIHLTDVAGRIVTLPTHWRLASDTAPGTTPRAESLRHHGALRTGPRRTGVRRGGASGELHGLPAGGDGSVWVVAWPPAPAEWGFGPSATQLDAVKMVAHATPVHLQVGSLDARILTLDTIDVTSTEAEGGREQVTLAWEAFDPLLMSARVATSVGSMASGATRVVTIDGTASTPPVVTLTGAATNPRVTNESTGESFEWFGTLTAGQEFVIDAAALTARLDGVSVLGAMSDAFALGFSLAPGPNTLRFEASAGSADVTLAWRERWY